MLEKRDKDIGLFESDGLSIKISRFIKCSKNCDIYCVPKKFILVHNLSKVMFDNVRKKKKSLTKYIYFFYFVPVYSLPFLSLRCHLIDTSSQVSTKGMPIKATLTLGVHIKILKF